MASKISIICNGSRNIFIELVKSIEDSISNICEYKTYWLPLISKNKIPYSNINIIVYGRYLNPPKNSLNILVHTEQSKSGFGVNHYDKILDLFPSKNSTYLPLGYSKYFDNYQEKEEDIDFLFYGGLSDRRLEIIRKYNVHYDRILFGKERDDLINRTKWNLNIKDKDDWHYTPLRGILIMSKGKVLLQEELHKNGKYGYHEPYLIKFNKNNLLEVANKWGEKKRKEFGMYAKESLMKTPFKEIFLKKISNIGIR